MYTRVYTLFYDLSRFSLPSSFLGRPDRFKFQLPHFALVCRDTGRERRGNKRDLARPIKIVINSLCAENLINRADNLSVTVFCLAALFVSV